MVSPPFILLSLVTISLAAPSDFGVGISSRASCKQVFKTKSKETCYSLDEKFKLVSGSILKHNTFLNCADVWTGSDICVPDGPYLADVCKSTYRSKKGDTCASLDIQFDLTDGTIKSVNSYLDCKAGIWEYSSICIPAGPRRSPPPVTVDPNCKETYRTVTGDTGTTIETKFGLASNAIKAFNGFVNCENLWKDTPICIPKGSAKAECRSLYVSKKDDTCSSIEMSSNLPTGSLKTANSYLNCADIWAGTPLCLPIATVTPTPNPAPTPPTCGANEAAYSTSAAGTTCTVVEQALDLFPGALKSHTPGINCDNLPVASYCVPSGPKMAATCSSIRTTGTGETCNTIGTALGLAQGAIAIANPLLPCGGTTTLAPSTRVCIPAAPTPPPAPACIGREVTVAPGQNCDAIEIVNDWFSYTLTTYLPSLSCNSLPEDTKLCLPVDPPKMTDFCPQDAPGSRTTTQYPYSCFYIAGLLGGTTVPTLKALNPLLPCSGADLPAGTRVCLKGYT